MRPGSTSLPPAAMAESTAALTAASPTYRMLVLAGKADWLLPSCRGWSLMPRRSNSGGMWRGLRGARGGEQGWGWGRVREEGRG